MPGELALVLHTHMPYVEGFGTWPFGEEWLWEAMATSYLPLLDVLDERVTLSMTPVLCDQLEAEGVGERFERFLTELRPASHALDIEAARAAGDDAQAAELQRAAGQYAEALERYRALGGDLLGALAPHVAWTSSATHAVLPLVALEEGVRRQVRVGIAAHRARFGDWRGGFWLPECAHAGWLDGLLEDEGVAVTCVDLTDVEGVDPRTPLRSEDGPVLVPIDREVLELVWSDAGYPAGPAYRDSHHLTDRDHKPWANDGAIYDPARAAAAVRADAAEFVARAAGRVAGGGLSVCAVDTELLGLWWHEGVDWLAAVLEQAEGAGLRISHLDDALERHPPVAAPAGLPVTTWGTPRTLWTWDGPQVADLAWRARRAELDLAAAGQHPPPRAERELLALQASDWAFLDTRGTAGPYARERFDGHEAQLRRALDGGLADPALRNLCPLM